MRRTPESTPCQGRSEFTSDDRDVLLRVAMVCFHCPVRVACREGAESRGEEYGVWGGKVFGGHKKPGPKGPRSHYEHVIRAALDGHLIQDTPQTKCETPEDTASDLVAIRCEETDRD